MVSARSGSFFFWIGRALPLHLAHLFLNNGMDGCFEQRPWSKQSKFCIPAGTCSVWGKQSSTPEPALFWESRVAIAGRGRAASPFGYPRVECQ
jgi:hypothetical protein